MKAIKILLVPVSIFVSGCAYDASSVSTFFHGPIEATESEVQSMAELAWANRQNGNSPETACSEARSQLSISSQRPAWDAKRCTWRLQEMRSLQAQEDAKHRMREHTQRRAKEFSERVAEIRAGKAEIRDEEEAAEVYQATNGRHLALSPLVQPDNRKYTFSGFLDASQGLRPDRILINTPEFGGPRYAYIHLPPSIRDLPSETRVGSRVFIVGNYVSNRSYTTLRGESRLMPVFQAEFIKVLN